MKKFFAALLCTVLALLPAACGSTASKSPESAAPSDSAQIANPFVDCRTLDEAAGVAGFRITVPEKIGDKSQTVNAVRDSLIQVFYDAGGDSEICVRKGRGSSDISGDYNVYAVTKKVAVGSRQVTMKGTGVNVSLAVWTEGDYSFSVAFRAGATQKDAETLVRQIA